MGITCAICYSTVDDSFAPGIGSRLDGWAARDLDIGQIIAVAPNLQPVADFLGVDVPTVKKVVTAWGPGKFDAELFLDGKGFRPDGKTAATLIPPAYGLAGAPLHTWIGWGNVTQWNAFVSVLEMHGKGTYYDPRLRDAAKFPVAARNGSFDVKNDPDLVTSKLPSLHLYQLNIQPPPAPPGSFDEAVAARGAQLFSDKARCASCHVPPLYLEPGWPIHSPEEQRGYRVEAAVIQAVDAAVPVARLRQQLGFIKGLLRSQQSVSDEGLSLFRHRGMPSRVTFSWKGMARKSGLSHSCLLYTIVLSTVSVANSNWKSRRIMDSSRARSTRPFTRTRRSQSESGAASPRAREP